MIQAKLKTTLVISLILACAFLGLREIGRGQKKGQVDAVVLTESPQAAASGGASASSGFARFLPWKAKPTDPIEAAELAALEQWKEILYSTESDVGMPPAGIWESMFGSGVKISLAPPYGLFGACSGAERGSFLTTRKHFCFQHARLAQ